MDHAPAHAPSSPRKVYSISASEQDVRRYLKDGFTEINGKLKRRHPEVKPHLKTFLKRLDSMPDFWMQLPKQVEISLQKYGAELAKKGNEAKKEDWRQVAASAEKVAKSFERRAERVPTIIRVIRLVDKLANHPTQKQADLEDQLSRITGAIQRNTLTSEQKEEAQREKRRVRKEEKKALEEEKKEERKAKRLSLNSPLQPLETVGTSQKLTLEQKREWRKSYDPKLLGPVNVNPQAIKNNPQFGIIGVYKQRALLNGWNTSAFDATVENKVLPLFGKMEGQSIEALREDLKALFAKRRGEESFRPATLAADPHQLLRDSFSPLAADSLQLYPVFVRMLVRAAVEAVPAGTKLSIEGKDFVFPMVAGTAYLETKDFQSDYLQLQAALRFKTEAILQSDVPDNPHLATVDELKKTLSSPRRTRKGIEKHESGTEQESSTPRTDPELSEKSKPRKLNKRENTTTTTTTTATTLTTTIGTSGSTASPVKSPSQKGLVRLYSASEDDMSPTLKPTFEAVVGQLNAVYEKFGPHAGSGAMKLIIALKELYEQSAKKETPLEEMLTSAVEKANLSKLEGDVLEDAGVELANKRAKPIGRSEQARHVGEFLIKVHHCLSANREKVND